MTSPTPQFPPSPISLSEADRGLLARVTQGATSRRIASPSGRVAWHQWGHEGPTLVLIPGGFGSWRHWVHNVLHLAARYRVFCVEPLGLGDSDAPGSDRPSVEELIDPIVATLPAAIGESVAPHIVGFSFGGILAGNLAVALGKRAASLTVSGSGAMGWSPKELPAARSIKPTQAPDDLRAAYAHNLGLFMLQPQSVDDLAIALEHESVVRSRIRYTHIMWSLSLREALERCTCPIGAIWAENDPFCVGKLDLYRDFYMALPTGGLFRVVEGASHWAMYESPNRYNEILDELIAVYLERS